MDLVGHRLHQETSVSDPDPHLKRLPGSAWTDANRIRPVPEGLEKL